MEIKLSKNRHYAVIVMIGQFRQQNDYMEFEEAIDEYIRQKNKLIVLDMSRLSFISSRGLGKIINAYSRCKAGGYSLLILSPKGAVKETIDIAGFGRFIDILSSTRKLAQYMKDKKPSSGLGGD